MKPAKTQFITLYICCLKKNSSLNFFGINRGTVKKKIKIKILLIKEIKSEPHTQQKVFNEDMHINYRNLKEIHALFS